MSRIVAGIIIAFVTTVTLLVGSANSGGSANNVDLPIPTVTVSIPVTPPVGVITITAPPRTITITPPVIPQPIPTRLPTVKIPRVTRTVIVRPTPRPAITITVRQPLKPSSSLLSGQTPTGRGTVVQPAEPKTRIETRTRTETVVKRILLGTLLSILFFIVGVLALFIGYYLGGRDAYRKDDKFMRGLLVTYKRKH